VLLKSTQIHPKRHGKTPSSMAMPLTPRRMTFEPVLNIRDDVDLPDSAEAENMYFKSSINPVLGWLAMSCGQTRTPNKLLIVDLADNTVIFEHRAYGRYSHHWITIKGDHYLSLQTAGHTVTMFKVHKSDRKLTENSLYRIKLGRKDKIDFIEFDASFNFIFLIRNSSILEQRPLSKVMTVTMSMNLQKRIRDSVSKLMTLSNDGKWAVITSGGNAYVNDGDRLKMVYFIDIENKKQYKVMTQKLTNSYSPCFVNGDSQFVAVGGGDGEGVEIWSVADRKMVRHIDVGDDGKFVSAMYSANNVFAVGLGSINFGALKLWDTRTWKEMHGVDCHMTPRSLYMSEDSKYIAMSGTEHEKCIILRVKK